MYILIENHTDEMDTYCRLRGAFRSKKSAKKAMEDLYDTARKYNSEYEVLDAWLQDNAAFIGWDGIPDTFDWYIFEAKCE